MNHDTLADVVALAPKPRGEGTYTWFRYWTIRTACILNGQGRKCPVKGCPESVASVGSFEWRHCWVHEPDRTPEERAQMSRINPGSYWRRDKSDPRTGLRVMIPEHWRAWKSSL
jgi:hypothetical protein